LSPRFGNRPLHAIEQPSADATQGGVDGFRRSADLLRDALGRISELTGLAPAYPLDSDLYVQMGSAPLPAETDLPTLKSRLYSDFRVEVPLVEWQGRKLMRISAQAYNSREDIDALLGALKVLLPEAVSPATRSLY
jgi:selenocysteine lyase/cysteine desulfurase